MGGIRRRTMPKAVIFDLGDVLFTWSPATKTIIPPKMIYSMLSSATWENYECGHIREAVCYQQLAQQFSIPVQEVAEAFSQARDSLQPNKAMVSFIHDLRKLPQMKVEVFAMSNISKEDYAVLSTKMADWSIFEQVFTSGHVGIRKPDQSFYYHVLKEINMSPQEVVFIDDKEENVRAAESLGIKGVVFNDTATVLRTLRNIFDDPVERGYRYLQRNAGYFNSITSSGIEVPDNFAQLLILEATQDRNLVNIEWGSRRTWNFFIGKPVLVPGGYFPDDLDVTALALMVLQPPPELATSLLDEMLTYVNPDGSVQTYYDRRKPRTDPVVSANVLACFYAHNRGHELDSTLQSIHSALLNRDYMHGTRYYPTPDACLFFFTRLLLQIPPSSYLHTTLHSLLLSAVKDRLAQPGNAFDLAVRILACSALDPELDCSRDRDALRDMQCEDGGWEAGQLYRYGSTGLSIGNRGVTSAFAVKALGVGVNLKSAMEGEKGLLAEEESK